MKSKNYNKVFNILKRKYFKYIELDPVIESKFILQRSGENFKKYLFSFYNSDGQELSLRPDLTISSVIRYAQSKSNKKEKVFYTGSAFRKSYNKKNVVVRQIGMEIFSSSDLSFFIVALFWSISSCPQIIAIEKPFLFA